MGRRAAARARGRPGAGCARALPAAPRAKRGTPAGRVGGRRRPFPYARRTGQLGFPGKREKAKQKQTLGELFPLAWNFIGNTCAEEAGTRGGGAGIFRSVSRGVGLGPAARARRRRPGQLRRDRPPRRTGAGRGGPEPAPGPWPGGGPALPWWFSSGMYILVFSLTIHQKLF